MTNFERAIRFTLEREGDQYVWFASDRGGPTKYGITLKTLQAYRGVFISEEDVKNLTQEEAVKIYAALYWNAAKLERIKDPNTALILFDFGVNAGTQTAIRLLQTILKESFSVALEVDGVLGNATYEALCKVNENQINRLLIQGIQLYYSRICIKNPRQLVFLEGWLKRTFLFPET